MNAALPGDLGEQGSRDSLGLTRQAFVYPDATEGAAAFREERPARCLSSRTGA